MKIRIKGNSIRFRLTRSEVSQLCEKGTVEDRTIFEEGVFNYGVQLDDNTKGLHAEIKDNKIVLKVSADFAENWDKNEKVGLKDTSSLQNGTVLGLLLEKDFTCMSDRGENESDNYPNPKLTSVSKDAESASPKPTPKV